MIESIEVAKRDVLGSRAMIKIRKKGLIPAILYGHGQENVCLTVSLDTVNSLIKHGTKLVTLTGEVVDTALLRSVQWSNMGDRIIHVDFARVSQTETVEVLLPIRLHGETIAGGQLRFVTHEILIRCSAMKNRLLNRWLEERPTEKILDAWRNYAQALARELDEASLEVFRQSTLGRARRVANASGGIFGLGEKISDNERHVLHDLANALTKPNND